MKTQLYLNHSERSRLKQLIVNQQLTDALDLLRGAAYRELVHRSARISEEQLVRHLQTWQRILSSVSETDKGRNN